VRVLLETTPLGGAGAGRGLGRYVRELRAALEEQGDLQVFNVPTGAGRCSEIVALPRRHRELRQRSYDVLYAPSPLHVPVRSGRPWVASILDTIPLDVVSHRQTGAKTLLFYRLASRADAVLTLSEDAAGRIVKRIGVPRSRVFVAPLPSPVTPTTEAPERRVVGLPGVPYAVAMADLAGPDPRKRIPWLAAVGERLERVGVPLVVVGPGTDSAGAPAHTHGLGRISDGGWSRVLSGASVFVYASAFEGQGLPPLEAMAHGVPVVAMANTAVVEVVGSAGVLVAERQAAESAAAGPHGPGDMGAQDLAAAVVAVMADPAGRTRMSADGLLRSGTFSTRRFRDAVRQAGAHAAASGGGV
jgi:glycosyltransferase involved in cell wall biosynthesis